MFFEKFYNLCLSKGTKPNPVAKKINVSSSTVTQWKQGAIPSGEVLIKVADYFDCSIDYLLGRTENPQSHKGVSDVSNKIAAKLSNLNDEAAKDVLKYINLMAASGHYNKTSAEDEKKKA